MKKKYGKKILACAITASLVLSLASCGSGDNKENKEDTMLTWQGKKNVTVDEDSKWVDSAINGMIDEHLVTNIKDDFYSYVNKDWILEQTVDMDHMQVSFVTNCDELVKNRKISIVSDTVDPEAYVEPDIDITPEELAHDEALVQQFTTTAADWDQRNALGYTPVMPYIEAIENISNMQEMADYIADVDGANLSGRTFFLVSIDEYGLVDSEHYKAVLQPVQEFNLRDMFSYLNMNGSAQSDKFFMEKMAMRSLQELGYTAEEAESIIHNAYDIEGQLTDAMDQNSQTMAYYGRIKDGEYTIDELQAMAGDYPLAAYLEKVGFDKAEHIYTAEERYVKHVGHVFKEENLSKIKDYYILSTALFCMRFVDRESFELLQERENQGEVVSILPDKSGGDSREVEIKDEWDLILNSFVAGYLAGPLDIVYVSRYCNQTQKQELTDLINQLIGYYEKMIDEETWLSEQARADTKEKLDAIKVNVLYPDHFESYMGIQFEPEDTLVQMIQKIRVDDIRRSAVYIDEKMDNSKWNLSLVPTTTINAQYIPSNNSINIFAGIVADGFAYNEDMSKEDKLARIGTIAGHEITHAFDTTGCEYDKYGNKKKWWVIEDTAAFQQRALKLTEYFDTLKGYPGSPLVVGTFVSGEAIADMGGMKATLEIAKTIDGFDYDKYFRSFAALWANKAAMPMASYLLEKDVHPLAFIRVNATVIQYEKFYETYDIHEGDGMYLAPEKRTAVW